MGAPRGFEALANLDQLGNDELNSLVLSNWLKLNRALKAGQPLPVLRRLLCLELERGPSVRLVIAERLRAAVSRALAREHEQACTLVLTKLMLGMKIERAELLAMGFDTTQADQLLAHWAQKSEG